MPLTTDPSDVELAPDYSAASTRASHDGASEDSLAPYLDALRSHVRALVIVPLVLAMIAVAGSLALPRRYVARASFVPQESSGSRSSLSAIAAQFGLSNLGALAGAAGGGSGASPQFYADLLRSRELLRTVVRTRFAVASEPPFQGTLVEYFKEQRPDSQEATLRAMKALNERALAVDVDRQTGVVRFAVTLKNRQLAEHVSRRFLDLVNDFNVRRRRSTVTAERDFAESRAEEAYAQLRRAENALTDFRNGNRALTLSPTLAAQEAALQRRVTLAQQVYTGLAQQYESSKIEAVRNTPVITVIDAPEGLVEAVPRGTAAKALLGFALGLTGAAAWAILVEARRRRAAR
jgi:uncharacterized protein involved in exopolysaccharide biosynthesis